MRAYSRIEFVAVWVGGIVLFSFSVFAADPKLKSAGRPPAVEPRFRPGDTLAVASERAQLLIGDQVLALLRKGQRVIVAEVREPWVGTHVMHGGEKKAGWIHIHDFLPPAGAGHPDGTATATAESVPQVQISTSASATVAEAAERAPCVFLRSGRSAEREYWDDFLIGKYDRHETDPNIHVWEPWRHR